MYPRSVSKSNKSIGYLGEEQGFGALQWKWTLVCPCDHRRKMLPTVLWLPRRKLLQLVPDSPSQEDRFRAASEALFNWSTILSGYLFSHSSDTPSSVPCSVQKAFEESPFPPTAHKVARQLGIDSEGGAWHETFYLEFYHGLFLCSFCFSLDSHQMGAWDQRLWANILTSLSYEGDHHSH